MEAISMKCREVISSYFNSFITWWKTQDNFNVEKLEVTLCSKKIVFLNFLNDTGRIPSWLVLKEYLM